MHRYSTRQARCIPQCTVAVLVMHTVFHNARLQFSSGRCVPQWTVEFSSCTLCSKFHGWVFVPKCTVAVLIMTLCSTMHGRVLVMLAVFHNAWLSSRSTLHGCSSRHTRCVPQCTVEFSFHNAPLQFSSATLCSTMHGCSSRHDAVLHNARLEFSLWRCVPQYTVAVLIEHAVFHNAR